MIRISLIILLFFASCSSGDDKNEKILPPEKMELVLWDVIEADVYTWSVKKKDSAVIPVRENALMQEAIFQKHNISRQQYYTSLDYYMAHSAEFVPMLDSMMADHPAVQPGKNRKRRQTGDSLRLIPQ